MPCSPPASSTFPPFIPPEEASAGRELVGPVLPILGASLAVGVLMYAVARFKVHATRFYAGKGAFANTSEATLWLTFFAMTLVLCLPLTLLAWRRAVHQYDHLLGSRS